MTVTGRSLADARATRRRMTIIAGAGWGAFVVAAVVLTVIGGVAEGHGRTLVTAAVVAAVIAGVLGLVGVGYATHEIRSIDVDVPTDPPPPPAGPAAEAPATARWLDDRGHRIRRWLIGWGLALGCLIVVFAVAGDEDRLAGFHAAEAVGVVVVLAWLTCTVALAVNIAGRAVFRRQLAQPWHEVRCEIVERPQDAAGRLGNPVARIELPDGSAHTVRLRRLAVWTRMPVPADGRAHPAWWASGDGENGCVATPGGAPVVNAAP